MKIFCVLAMMFCLGLGTAEAFFIEDDTGAHYQELLKAKQKKIAEGKRLAPQRAAAKAKKRQALQQAPDKEYVRTTIERQLYEQAGLDYKAQKQVAVEAQSSLSTKAFSLKNILFIAFLALATGLSFVFFKD